MAGDGTAIIVLVDVGPEDARTLRDYHRRNVEAQSEVQGFQSLTVWGNPEDETDFLLVSNYQDERAADNGLKASMEVGPLVARMKRVLDPPDVRRTRIVVASGQTFDSVPVGGWLSISIRTADPGYGSDLVDELETIFGELAVIDGFLGYATCRNSALREEVVGLAFWEGDDAYRKSVPLGRERFVKAYQRVM